MRPLTAKQITGNWATVLLPLNEDDSIDWPRLEDQVDALIGFGVDGVYTNGSAGEFWSQTESEFDRLSSAVAERCERSGMPFQLGACHMSPQLSLERIRRARGLKPGAIQVIFPDWWPPADDEVISAIARFAEAADPIGIVLYNPPHAKRALMPETFARLKRAVPGLVGVKVAGGDQHWYELMRKKMAGLSVFASGHQLATGIKLGANGSYSNVACLHPGGAQRWYRRMYRRDELLLHMQQKFVSPGGDAALELEGRIQRFLQQHILPFRDEQGFSNFALDKLLAAIGEWADIGTRVRWPYRSIPEDEANRLRPVAHACLPELFKEGTQ